jgi:hypothetical protein
MIRTATLLIASAALLCAACDRSSSTPAPAPPAGPPPAAATPAAAPQQSPTLKTELDAVTQEAPTIEVLPPELIAAALTVTPAEEAKFARSRFDDAANRASVKKSMNVWIDFGASLPGVTRYLRDQDRAKPLTGVRLELFARLLKPEINPTLTNPVKK